MGIHIFALLSESYVLKKTPKKQKSSRVQYAVNFTKDLQILLKKYEQYKS